MGRGRNVGGGSLDRAGAGGQPPAGDDIRGAGAAENVGGCGVGGGSGEGPVDPQEPDEAGHRGEENTTGGGTTQHKR